MITAERVYKDILNMPLKETMPKLLLLDADVVIDLHALGLFEKISNPYDIYCNI